MGRWIPSGLFDTGQGQLRIHPTLQAARPRDPQHCWHQRERPAGQHHSLRLVGQQGRYGPPETSGHTRRCVISHRPTSFHLDPKLFRSVPQLRPCRLILVCFAICSPINARPRTDPTGHKVFSVMPLSVLHFGVTSPTAGPIFTPVSLLTDPSSFFAPFYSEKRRDPPLNDKRAMSPAGQVSTGAKNSIFFSKGWPALCCERSSIIYLETSIYVLGGIIVNSNKAVHFFVVAHR